MAYKVRKGKLHSDIKLPMEKLRQAVYIYIASMHTCITTEIPDQKYEINIVLGCSHLVSHFLPNFGIYSMKKKENHQIFPKLKTHTINSVTKLFLHRYTFFSIGPDL